MNQNTSQGSEYLRAVRREFVRFKELGEKAIAQLTGSEPLHVALDPESNSIAVLVRHLSGNMISRWTDFLTTDGEKPDRHRDREFEPESTHTRAELLDIWSRGWSRLFSSFDALGPNDLLKTITIRGEEHLVVQAIARQLGHCAYHVGQIVLLAKHLASDRWRSLSIPRGKSEEFFRRKGGPSSRD